jgi:chromosome segregation ATPase
MPDEYQGHSVDAPEPQSHLLRYVLLAVAMLYVIVSLYFLVDTTGRVAKLEDAQKAAAGEQAQLLKKLGMTEESLKQAEHTQEELANKLGSTQKQVVVRTSQLEKQQKEAEQRLSEETQQKVGAVSGEVAGVKTELGGTKTDLAATKTDLEATKAKLEKTIGDLGVQSGLIAHSQGDIEYLKHRGDRNIVEFTLDKGAKPKPVGTVSLQLKKVDAKKSKYTLNVMADDRTIEKKDRTLFEPLQFLSGKDRALYEVVVISATKKSVSGYLSTPKNVPSTAGLNQP